MLSKPLYWKVTFPVTSKPTPPTVFNLQASDWVLCEEETGAYYQLSRHTYKLVKKLHILKIVYFAPKNTRISKNHINLFFFFFQKEIIGHTYIFTKWIDNFKFFISLKSYEE